MKSLISLPLFFTKIRETLFLRMVGNAMLIWLIINSLFVFNLDVQDIASTQASNNYSTVHHAILKQYHSQSKSSTNYLEEEVEDESSEEFILKKVYGASHHLNFDIDFFKELNTSLFFTITQAVNRPLFLLFHCWRDFIVSI